MLFDEAFFALFGLFFVALPTTAFLLVAGADLAVFLEVLLVRLLFIAIKAAAATAVAGIAQTGLSEMPWAV